MNNLANPAKKWYANVSATAAYVPTHELFNRPSVQAKIRELRATVLTIPAGGSMSKRDEEIRNAKHWSLHFGRVGDASAELFWAEFRSLWQAIEQLETEKQAESTDEADPCPFCGKDSIVVPLDTVPFHAECEYCGVRGPAAGSLKEAYELWNTFAIKTKP